MELFNDALIDDWYKRKFKNVEKEIDDVICSTLKKIVVLKQKLHKLTLEYNEIGCDAFPKICELFSVFFNDIEFIWRDIDNPLIEKDMKNIFQESLMETIKESKLLSHGYSKPRGYPGDYQIVEAMYENKPVSTGFGSELDKYFLQYNYVQAVRDRKDAMKDILLNKLKDYASNSVNILNLACGGCRELREILPDLGVINKKITFMLVDQDEAPIKFSQNMLLSHAPDNLVFNFYEGDITSFYLKRQSLIREFGKQDLIYSIGLADYLPNSMLFPMIKFGVDLLKEHGEMYVAYKNTAEYPSPDSDWGCNWHFYARGKSDLSEDLRKLLRESGITTTFRDITNLIFFTIFHK